MARVYLIRHARPASTWGGADEDPGLDAVGHEQAAEAARALLALPPAQRPTTVVSSPLRRCQETAAPFAALLDLAVAIDPLVGEIPTPRALTPEARPDWLRGAMAGRWADIAGDLDYDNWRRSVAAAVAARPGAAVFSHFVAINAVLSLIAGREEVIVLRPDHASIHVLDTTGGRLTLVDRGREASTSIL